jgi:hypothetical protein
MATPNNPIPTAALVPNPWDMPVLSRSKPPSSFSGLNMATSYATVSTVSIHKWSFSAWTALIALL